jgi:hypothetical protein
MSEVTALRLRTIVIVILMRFALVFAVSILGLIWAIDATSAAPRLPTAAYLLTQTSIVKVDTTTWKPATKQTISLHAPRKVAYGDPFVFVLHTNGVDVLDAQSLRTLRTLSFASEVRDIAGSRSMLLVAAGNRVELLRLGRDGTVQDRSAVTLVERAAAIAVEDTRAYILDDSQSPINAYIIDLRRPTQPPATFRWNETNGLMKAQAIADRWYVLLHFNTASQEGESITILPSTSPLRVLERRSIDAKSKTAPQDPPPWFIREFRVHRDILYGLYDDGRQIILIRRSIKPEKAPIQLSNPMGPARLAPEARRGIVDLVGDHLYVAAAMGVQVFDLAMQRSVGPGGILVDSPVISFTVAR